MSKKDPHFFLFAAPAVRSETRTIHEHRAPTDESVRLLAEMEKAAMEKIVGRITTGPNVMDSTWIVQSDEYGFSRTFICRYSLNGVDHTFKTSKDIGGLKNSSEEGGLLREIFEEFSAHFARHFVPSLLENHKAQFIK